MMMCRVEVRRNVATLWAHTLSNIMQQSYPTPGRYIDPLTDFGFKRLFGNEPNKEILIDFLNQLFLGQKVIKNLTYSQTEFYGDNGDSKRAIFDLLCTGDNGEQFIVEMQRGRQTFLKKGPYFTLPDL